MIVTFSTELHGLKSMCNIADKNRSIDYFHADKWQNGKKIIKTAINEIKTLVHPET